MNRESLSLKDAAGRPLWVPLVREDEVKEINGASYELNEESPCVDPRAAPLVFGNFTA